jgi:ubiquinone/menaquinone biosynthesis C-methylase UbiE
VRGPRHPLAQKVLDVGAGNVSPAAARRWCEVTATDYVPTLLDRARERADAERLDMEFREADAEALPLADESFDVVPRHAARSLG